MTYFPLCVCVCVCVCARARTRVCVCARARTRLQNVPIAGIVHVLHMRSADFRPRADTHELRCWF